jgi:L-lactate dehydrogenase complex protein LldG
VEQWREAAIVLTSEDGVPADATDVVRRAGGRVIEWGGGAGRADVEAADVGVTSARWGIAETGSVVVSSAPPGGRAPGLLPPVHVVFIPAERVVATTADFFRALDELPSYPSNLVIVTGPSKSSDIGMELAVGVHGPAELHIVIVE